MRRSYGSDLALFGVAAYLVLRVIVGPNDAPAFSSWTAGWTFILQIVAALSVGNAIAYVLALRFPHPPKGDREDG